METGVANIQIGNIEVRMNIFLAQYAGRYRTIDTVSYVSRSSCHSVPPVQNVNRPKTRADVKNRNSLTSYRLLDDIEQLLCAHRILTLKLPETLFDKHMTKMARMSNGL
jgi:hypothetical protein